jgi:hypothetical protein
VKYWTEEAITTDLYIVVPLRISPVPIDNVGLLSFSPPPPELGFRAAYVCSESSYSVEINFSLVTVAPV